MRLPTPTSLRYLHLFAAMTLLAGCSCHAGGGVRAENPGSSAAAARTPEPSRVERWVDPAAEAGGDGSRARPFKTLDEALEADEPARLHLAPGRYEGSFEPAPGVVIVGAGRDVTTIAVGGLSGRGEKAAPLEKAAPPVIRPQGALTLEALEVEGGEDGIETAFALTARNVRMSGQRRTALALLPGARLVLENAELRLQAKAGPGVRAEGASLLLRNVQIVGAATHALQLRGESSVQIVDSRFDGPANAISQRGGKLELKQVDIRGGAGPAVFVGGAELDILDLEVVGHEFALQTGGDAKLRVQGLKSRGATRAGLGLVKSEGVLKAVQVSESGSFAGVQVISSKLRFEDLRIEDANGVGLIAIAGADVTLASASIARIRDPEEDAGNALEVRRSRLTFKDVALEDVAGVGLFASESSTVNGGELRVKNARWSAIAAELHSRVTVEKVVVSGTTKSALMLPGPAEIEVGHLVLQQPELDPVSADCAAGANVRIRRLEGAPPATLDEPCVAGPKP